MPSTRLPPFSRKSASRSSSCAFSSCGSAIVPLLGGRLALGLGTLLELRAQVLGLHRAAVVCVSLVLQLRFFGAVLLLQLALQLVDPQFLRGRVLLAHAASLRPSISRVAARRLSALASSWRTRSGESPMRRPVSRSGVGSLPFTPKRSFTTSFSRSGSWSSARCSASERRLYSTSSSGSGSSLGM